MSCCVDQVDALEGKILGVTPCFLFCHFLHFLHFCSCWSFNLVLLVIIFTPTSGILPDIAPGTGLFRICNGIFNNRCYTWGRKNAWRWWLWSQPLSHVFHREVSSDLMSAHWRRCTLKHWFWGDTRYSKLIYLLTLWDVIFTAPSLSLYMKKLGIEYLNISYPGKSTQFMNW